MTKRLAAPLALTLALLSGACASKRSFLVLGGAHAPQEALVERVAAAGEEMHRARAQFADAFHLYQRLTAPQAVGLGDLSDAFQDSLEECRDHAGELDDHVEAVREELDDLVKGWSEELSHFNGETMRKKSEAMLHDTEERSRRVLQGLERLQARMKPVTLKLRDYSLFFHHNLSPRAIATLEDTYKDFDAEFHALDTEFEKTEGEVAAFMDAFTVPSGTPEKP